MNTTCLVTALKEQRGLNRRQLANDAGVGYETLSRIERGQHVTISDDFAQKLGKFFHVDATVLQDEYVQWKASLVKTD